MFAFTHTIQAFHSAFNAFIRPSQYYKTLYNELKAHVQTSSNGITLICLYRDSMSPEPDSYKELCKHLHCEGFEQCQRTARKGQVGMARKARWMLWRKVRSTSGSYHVYILAS